MNYYHQILTSQSALLGFLSDRVKFSILKYQIIFKKKGW